MKSTDEQASQADSPAESHMKPWKAAWLSANRAYKGMRTGLWKMTQLLNQVFDDAEFRADNGLRDDAAAADWIDSKLPELPIGYMELRTILRYYPDKSSWEGTKLSKLRDSIKPATSTKPARPRAAKVDAVQMKRERDFFAAKAKMLEKKVEQVAKESMPVVAGRPVTPKQQERDDVLVMVRRLTTILQGGVDCENTELMLAIEHLKLVVDSVIEPVLTP